MRRWASALLPLLLLGNAGAAAIKLRPQGAELVRAVETAIAQLGTKDIPMTLDPSAGPTLTLGGVGVSAAPFNPDQISRVVTVGSERRIEINPKGPVPLAEAVKQTLQAELKLKDWTPAAAQQRFGGADLNGDGAVDLTDLAILMGNFGTSTGAPGDLNQDRKVDDADVKIFSALYSAAIAQPAPPAPEPEVPKTPEPASPSGTPNPAAPATTPPATTAPATTTPATTTPATTTPDAPPATPANANPTNPAPTDPIPGNSAPSNPAPGNPAPTQPETPKAP